MWGLCLVAFLLGRPAVGADTGFTLHGYLTQAYATSSDFQILGIPTDGTTDYRTLALQFRYDITAKDSVVVQLSHESIGNSPYQALRNDVDLDWAFYKHTFATGTSVRVGRVPIPFGIYNELRDVGTVLEFYRPPVGMYLEGGLSNEALDGLVVGHTFFGASDWPLNVDVYYGSWDRPEPVGADAEALQAKAQDAIGTQLWLETPLDGLRIGAAAQTIDIVDGDVTVRPEGRVDPYDVWAVSLDFNRDRFYARAEMQKIDTELDFAPKFDITAWYAQAGVRFGAWQVNALYEYSDWDAALFFGPGFPLFPYIVDPYYEDIALGVNYSFGVSTVLKLEYHDIETQILNEDEIFDPLNPATSETELFIASLSVSF